jgi:hypothetical protein
MPNSVESRLNVLEHNYYDVHARLARSEDTATYLHNKCQMLSEGLMRCHQVRSSITNANQEWMLTENKQWNQDLATYLMTMVSDSDNQIHKDGQSLQFFFFAFEPQYSQAL